MARKKVAILGSGAAAMAAASEITSTPDWNEHFDVTIYTLGWRMGGKGASGRNADRAQRIEEHGLHVWLGFYDNAFRVIKRIYEENARPIDAPLATWRSAFTPIGSVLNVERVATPKHRHWTFHHMQVPCDREEPGVGDEIPDVHDAMKLAWRMFSEWLHGEVPFEVVDVAMPDSGPAWTSNRRRSTTRDDSRPHGHLWPHHAARDALRLARAVHEALRSLPPSGSHAGAGTHRSIIESLESLRELLRRTFARWLGRHDYVRTLLVYAEFLSASLLGAIRDGVVEHDWDAIDDYEWWEWLSRNGCDEVVKDSAIVRALYDFIFAYPCGDRSHPSCSAATMMRLVTRLWISYRGSMFWKMNAGMGDTIFAPMYEVLKKRGVRIEFFRKVVDLEPDDYGERIERIRIERQVELVSGREYQPLVDVKGLPCWPSEPLWDQIRDGGAIATRLREQGVTLESAWCHQRVGEPDVLTLGRDFDVVVLGIPVGALPAISQKLAYVDSRYREMLESVPTVETVASQVWLQPTLRSLGWQWPPTLSAGGNAPLDTYADMAHLLPVEDWSGPSVPQDLAYFCGVWECPAKAPLEDPEYPRRSQARAHRTAVAQYRDEMPPYWPQAKAPAGGAATDWDLLHAPNDVHGEERFAYQYWRANVSPDQRYTLALPGLNRVRLVTNETRFGNLLLAGDWTLNGLNAGTVEGSVMSGLQAAREICGRPKTIYGEPVLVKERITRARKGVPFVEVVAPQAIPGPVGISGMTLYAFALEASREGALQGYVDRTLNHPSRGAVRYEVLVDHLILYMATMARTWSMAPGLHAGWLPETDCGFWIPVGRMSGRGESAVVEDVALYPVAMYVDQPFTQVSGREIYGYPKGLGEFRAPAAPDDPGPYWLKTVLMRKYDPDREFRNDELWRIERVGTNDSVSVWGDSVSAFEMLRETFLGDAGRRLPPIRARNVLRQLLHAPTSMPMVFLKQFRAAHGETQACYQAILENVSRVTSFEGLGLMPGAYRFHTISSESVGLIEALGLRTEMDVIFAFWAKFDMVVGPGRLKWEAR
jgi:uncharacterized protein with NAD-binding domain and iron-sulfur cluster